MAIASFNKDPEAMLDYHINWSDWLDGDTIIASEWVTESGISIVADKFSDTVAVVWLSGGESRSRYEVTNRITTSGSRIDERTIRIKCKHK